MEKYIIIFVCAINVTFAQVIITSQAVIFKASNNWNIGFGKTTEIKQASKNSYQLEYILNGPLVQNNGKPVGGYIDNKNLMQSWTKPLDIDDNFNKQNGIFGKVKNDRMVLIPYQEFDKETEFEWAFQNGRILLLDGKNDHNPNSSNKLIRSGLGFNSSGELIGIISKIPVSFYELSEIFKSQECTNAIFLDGADTYTGFRSKDRTDNIGIFHPDAIKIQFYSTVLN